MKKLLLFVACLFTVMLSFAHVTEIRVNQGQDGSLTWYLQTYHGVNDCGHQNAGLTINGVNYPIDAEFSGSIESLSPTIFAQSSLISFGRNSYATVHTPFLGTTLTVAPYSNNVCWAFLVGGSGNFTPPPPPVCTSCPVTGWSNTVLLPGNNNGTPCNPLDDYTTATIKVNHLSCASITGQKQFRVIFDPTGANVAYGPFAFSSGIETDVNITIPYGTSNNSMVKVIVDDFPCENTHGLLIPNGQYLGEKETIPPTIVLPANMSLQNDPGTCGAKVTYAAPVVTDNCPNPVTTVQTAGLASGSVFPVGTTTNTFQATDAAGNVTIASFTVTVNDTEAPVPTSFVTGSAVVNIPSFVICCWNPGVINFADPLPAGAVVTGVSLSYSGRDQGWGGTGDYNALYVSGTYIGGNQFLHWTQSYNLNYNGSIPRYVYGGNNTFQMNFTGYPGWQGFFNGGTLTINYVIKSLPAIHAECSATAPVPTAKDNCEGMINGTTADPTTFNAQGTYTINWSYTDSKGNTSTQKQTVIIKDVTPPVITGLTSGMTVSNDAGVCGAKVNWTAPVATDNCGAVTLASDHHSGDVFPVGSTMVTYTATDAAGLTTTGSFTVTVTDNEKPVFMSASVQGTKTITIPYGGNTNGWSPWVYSFADPLPAGAVVTGVDLTYTAVDQGWGGTGAPSDMYVSGTYIGSGQLFHYTQTFNISKTTSFPGYVYGGTNTLQMNFWGYPGWVAYWKGGTLTIHYQVPPASTVPAGISVNNDAGKCGAVVMLTVPAAADNCGVQSVTNDAPGIFPVGTTTVTWTATDVHGNTNSAIQTVTVTDNEKPTITAPANIAVNNDAGQCGATVNIGTPVTNDNCGVSSVVNDHASATYPVGTTTVTWTVTDIHGNSSSTTQIVTVTDNEKPSIAAPANIAVNNDPGQCGATVKNIGTPVTSDNCGVASVVNDHASATYPVGTATVTWTVTDIHGNTNTAAQTIVVTDNEKPFITAPANISVNNDAGRCGATVNIGTPVTSDNCGVASVVSDHASATYPVGTTTVTWTVTDIHGNSSSATQTVTVTDNEQPTISVTNISVNNDAGKCSATVNLGTPVTGDNCGVASVVNDHASATYPVGTTVVNWTVTDIHGNSSSTTQTVVVTDNEKPVIACPGNQVFCANTGGNLQYTIPVLQQTDNCGIATTTYAVTGVTSRSGSGNNAGGTFNIGISTVSWTVTDIHGNTSTCSFTVKINPLPVASLTASTADAFCNKLSLSGSSTLSGPFGYQWNYASSSFAAMQQISLGLTNGDGVYSLYTTDGNGCRSELAATYNYVKQNLISSYTIVGFKEVDLGRSNMVQSGSVGVTSAKGQAEMGKGVSIAAAGAFLKAVRIDVDGTVNIPTRVYGAATPVLPTMIFNTATTKGLPDYRMRTAATVTVNGNYNNVTIKKGSNVTLTGNVFGNINIERGAQVSFSSPVVNVNNLSAGSEGDDGQEGNYDGDHHPAPTQYTTVKFAGTTQVLVKNQVDIARHTLINPNNYKVTFYVGHVKQAEHNDGGGEGQHGYEGDNNEDGKTAFNVSGSDAKVIGNVYMPNGKLAVKGNDHDYQGEEEGEGKITTNPTYLTGLYIANRIESAGRGVIWNSYDCSAAPVTGVTSTVSTQAVTQDKVKPLSEEAELKVTVMPNPTTTYFTLKLESKYNTPVNMRVTDASGRTIGAKSGIQANSTLQVGEDYLSGTYFAEFIQGTKRQVIQLIKATR